MNIINKSDEQLKKELVECVALTAKTIKKMALIWVELENRGINLEDLRSGISCYLAQVADESLAPEIVLSFPEKKTLIRHVSLLPLRMQEKLASGKTIDIVSPTDRGYFSVVQLPADKVPSAIYSQVFDYGKIRSKSQQERFLLEKAKQDKLKNKRKKRKTSVTYSDASKTIKVGANSVPLSDIVNAITKAGIDPAELINSISST